MYTAFKKILQQLDESAHKMDGGGYFLISVSIGHYSEANLTQTNTKIRFQSEFYYF